MKCPACGNIMEQMDAGDITVDVCKGGCGGIWFDQLKLKKVYESNKSAGERLLEIDRNDNIKIDHSKRRNCPKCVDMIMMRHFFSVKKEVEVDECPKCGGIWLDYGKLGKIQKQFNSEEEKKKAAEAYFSDIFSKELTIMRVKSEAQAERANNIARIFRFICPSYYIRRKHD